ncbi:MFS transporter [Oceanobacillus sojae]|uniref:MFS transporter n=1 Tax=Oceanobacillus sojae TaxID=582851 RepID=UPI0009886BB3|nr:MFS transporter [Oceanobacillus sojae]MCT1903905.1 MFS transporter [Oceanobacillus sojae]
MQLHQQYRRYRNQKDEYRDLWMLLLIGTLYAAGIFLSNTFVNVYLWKQSGDFFVIANYHLASYVFQALSFIYAGKLSKKIDRIIILRIGILFLCFFFLFVLWIGELAAYYNFILGCLLGIGYGFFWLAYYLLTFEITEPDTRDWFNGISGTLTSFAGMIGPLLAGWIISKMAGDVGYTAIFIISLSLFIAAIVVSFFIIRKGSRGSFALAAVINERKRNKNWKRILHAHFFQGLREGIYGFYITIWIFLVTNSELVLGVFNLFLSGLSIVFYFVALKWIKPYLRKKAILFGGILLFASIFIIIFEMSLFWLIIYAVIIGIAFPILTVPYESLTYDVIGRARMVEERRVEYIIVREIYLNLGRIASVMVFIFGMFLFPHDMIIPILLVIFGAGHAIIYFCIRNIFIGPTKKQKIALKEDFTDEKSR